MQRNVTNRPQQSQAKRIPLANPEIEGFKKIFEYQRAPVGRILWTSRDSVVRIIPGNDGGDFYPQVINTGIWTQDGNQLEYLSDTFYMVDVCDHFGEAAMDIVASLKPGTSDWERYPESPMSYFCNSIHRAVRAVTNGKKTRLKVQDVWRSWTMMGGTLPYPKQALFFQAVCQTINGANCKSSFDENAEEAPLYGIIGITHRDSINELVKALVMPMDRRKPIGTDNNNFGSLAELNGNWLYLNTAVNDKGKKFLSPSIQPSSAPASAWEPTEMNFQPEEAKALWVPWENAFNYLTVKEQLDLLCAEFGTETVQYVFSQDKEWEGLEFTTKVSMAAPKAAPAKPVQKAAGMSSLSSLKKTVKPVPKEEPEEAAEEPSWEPPTRASVSPANNPDLQATIAKIKSKIGQEDKGDLAQSLLDGINADELNI